MSDTAGSVRPVPITLHRGRKDKSQIHPRTTSGWFNTWRWALVWLTQLVFYGGCWLEWDGRQALLFDIAQRKIYLFGLVLWPQDALYLAFLLIVSACALFLVTTVAGRLFCGFACPQTVYTSLFRWVEGRIEGDHLARARLDSSPWTVRKLGLRSAKHGAWLAVAAWTGVTFVGYFTPVRELTAHLLTLSLGPWESFWTVFYGGFTYVQAGFAREMVCQHMCPYSRFQGVMFDPDTRTVSYDARRGEPRRQARSEGAKAAAQGDCVDCGICVQVCPTGIDIRDGLQYQCINCGLCVDACDTVMDKIGKPRGLIRFASERDLATAGNHSPGLARRLLRPRTLVYGGLLMLFTGLGIWNMTHRVPLIVDVLRDRGMLVRESAGGGYENTYTLKILNLSQEARSFLVKVEGLPGIRTAGPAEYRVGPGEVRTALLTVEVPGGTSLSGARPIRFLVRSLENRQVTVEEPSSFILP